MIERSIRLIEGRISGAVSNAHRSWHQRRSAIIELRSGNHVGRGEACPLPGYSPDDVEACAEALAAVALDGLDIGQARAIDSALPAARFALETALLDLAGQVEGRAIHQLLAPGRDPFAAVPIQALVTSDDDAARAVARGVRTLKIKLGRAPADELAFVARLRAAFPGVELRGDANGTDVDLEGAPLEICEEPGAALPATIGTALDESLRTLADDAIEAACTSGRVTMLVLKPTLLGGFSRCLEIAAIARRHGVRVGVSHCFDGPIALAAACELALVVADTASGLARHPALLAFPGAHIPQLRDSTVEACDRPGLGLRTGDALSVSCVPPERIAVVTPERTWSYGDVTALAAEVTPTPAGSTAIDATRSIATLARIYACLEQRSPAVLLHPRWSEEERRTQAARVGDVPDDAAVVVFTSGSQGSPKGVVLDRAALIASAEASEARLGWRDDDRWLLNLPLAHIGGLAIALRAIVAGGAIVLDDEPFDPERTAWLVESQRVTLASMVPTMLTRMLRELPSWTPPDHLRAVLLGGAAASPALITSARTRGVPVLPTYGMSEAGSQLATARPGELGLRPLPGVEIRTDETGRIFARSPTLMRGYLPPDTAPLEDGWLSTNDRGTLDERGDLHVAGRIDDLIISGGENIDPLEVETAFAAVPGVRAVCVLGVPDATWGEIVAALIEGDASDDDLARACEGMARFKRPRRIKRVERLPLSANGKIDRRAARALLS